MNRCDCYIWRATEENCTELSESEKDVLSCWRLRWHNNHVSFASFKYLQRLPHVRSPFNHFPMEKVTLSKLMLRLQVRVSKHHSDWFFTCLKVSKKKVLACHACSQVCYSQWWVYITNPSCTGDKMRKSSPGCKSQTGVQLGKKRETVDVRNLFIPSLQVFCKSNKVRAIQKKWSIISSKPYFELSRLSGFYIFLSFQIIYGIMLLT